MLILSQQLKKTLIDNASMMEFFPGRIQLHSGKMPSTVKRSGFDIGLQHYITFARRDRKWNRKERRRGRYVGSTFGMLFTETKMSFDTLKAGLSVLHGTKPIDLDKGVIAWTSALATIKLRRCDYGAELVMSPPNREIIAVLRAWRIGCQDVEKNASRPTPSTA